MDKHKKQPNDSLAEKLFAHLDKFMKKNNYAFPLI